MGWPCLETQWKENGSRNEGRASQWRCTFYYVLDPLCVSQWLQDSPFQPPDFLLHFVSQMGLLDSLFPFVLEDAGTIEALCPSTPVTPRWANMKFLFSFPDSSPKHSYFLTILLCHEGKNKCLSRQKYASAWHGSLPCISGVQKLKQGGSWVQSQPEIHIKTLSQNSKENKSKDWCYRSAGTALTWHVWDPGFNPLSIRRGEWCTCVRFQGKKWLARCRS